MSTTTTITEKDSTYVKETPRDVEVKIERDTVLITEYLECDSLTNKPKPIKIKKSSTRAAVAIEVSTDGKLTATAECDSLKKLIQAFDKEIFRLKHKETTTQTTTVKKPMLSWWGWLVVGFLLGIIIMLVLKAYLRI